MLHQKLMYRVSLVVGIKEEPGGVYCMEPRVRRTNNEPWITEKIKPKKLMYYTLAN